MRLRAALWLAAVLGLGIVTVAPTGHSHRPVHTHTQPVAALNAVARDHPLPPPVYPKPPAYLVDRVIHVTWPTTTTVPPTTTTPPTTAAPAYDPATEGMGAPGSFQACVAWRESTDGEGSSDIYGILPFVWTDTIGFAGSPYYASLATQDAAFWRLYDMEGTSPWAPYDGC